MIEDLLHPESVSEEQSLLAPWLQQVKVKLCYVTCPDLCRQVAILRESEAGLEENE